MVNMSANETYNELRCDSCKKLVEAEKDWVKFPCPKCGEVEIIRCGKCKALEITYTCSKCGFTGP